MRHLTLNGMSVVLVSLVGMLSTNCSLLDGSSKPDSGGTGFGGAGGNACAYGGASYGTSACTDAGVTTCNGVLFDNGNTAACTSPTNTSVFTLTSTSTVSSLRLWTNTTISGPTVTYTLLGPTGVTLSSGLTTKGGCDPYQTNWCEFLVNMNMSLAAGTYTVRSSAVATCANAGSNNVGFVLVKGCAAALPTPDAGVTTCNGVLFDNGNTAACTSPTNTSVFTLTSTSTVSSLRLWTNTTLSGQTVTYTLLNAAGTTLSSGATTKGGCDPYQTNWCEFLVNMNMTLAAGTYTVKSSAAATCANSGSGNVGMVTVKGCAAATPTPDAGGCPYGGAGYGQPGCGDAGVTTCNTTLFDNGNIAACTSPTDTSVFTLTSAATVSSLRLWTNTTISGQTVTYALLGPTGATLSAGPTTKGGCDPYQTNWCEFLVSMNMSLAAGTYTVKSSAIATCANSGSNNVGFVLVKGCAGSSALPDAGRDTTGATGGVDAGRDTTGATGGADAGVPPICGTTTPCPTVIHSTTIGGTWSDTSTWVEKIVPTATNDVEISGPVVIAAEAPCNNLTIKSGGSLQNVGRGAPYSLTPTTVNGNLTIEAGGTLTNEPGWSSRILVMGNCANNGTIKNSAAGVLLEVKKNFAQNGSYEGPSLTFSGGTDQTISCGAGKKIVGSITMSNPARSIKATSNMYLENVTVALPDATLPGTFDMNGFKLFVSGGAMALITDDTSNHVPRIKYTNLAGINCADGAMIYESSFANSSAPMTIDGVLTTPGRGGGGTQVTFDGDLTVNAGATMQNEVGWHSGVLVTGSLVNNGTINGRSGGYGFEIKKNFTQNNAYTATETTFSGAGVETMAMGAGKKIAGTIILANAKSGGTLKALSDLTVENVTFTVGDGTSTTAIDMSQYKLVLVGGTNALVCDDTSNHVPRVTFANIGGITGASPDPATDPMIWESSFANTSGTITLAGQFRTVGRGGAGTQIRFTGNVVLAAGALWRNEAGWRSGITISGLFTKNGTAVSDGGTNVLVINETAY